MKKSLKKLQFSKETVTTSLDAEKIIGGQMKCGPTLVLCYSHVGVLCQLA